MYDHSKQYRCTIIRGKSQKEIDDLLSAYAKIIMDICPCSKADFEERFNHQLSKYITDTATKKTLDNHRTEIAGKLFGMYYTDIHQVEDTELFVYPAERTMKFVEDNDQPAFFKDVCYKMQFPNGMTKSESVKERVALGISVRPNSYIVKSLLVAKNAGIELTKSDIGYYILNALDVLTSKATPYEVIEQIEKDKKANISRRVHTEGKATSFDNQHINEQINYLELANLIIVSDDGIVSINSNDLEAVNLFADEWDSPLLFDVKAYDLTKGAIKKKFQMDWDYHFSKLSKVAEHFATTTASLGIVDTSIPTKSSSGANKVELGDEGELYVLEYEKDRVKTFDARLAGKVIHLGKTRGLGYDIQSVIAEDGEMAEFVKYIEVKSTKRVTEPNLDDELWSDNINITRNEWIAAQQHRDFYSIFRVYFVRGNIIMYVIQNIHQKEKDGIIKVVPLTYRVDFKKDAIDEIILNKAQVV